MTVISWKDIEPDMQGWCVWANHQEIAWFQKAWNSLEATGLTTYATDVGRHWVIIRAITLGVMYHEYCWLEWDEHFDVESMMCELYWDETISHIRIGEMSTEIDDPQESDEMKLFVLAILNLVEDVRREIYQALLKGFGGDDLLYAGLHVSRVPGNVQEKLELVVEELFDKNYGQIKGRDEAFGYVGLDGMSGTGYY